MRLHHNIVKIPVVLKDSDPSQSEVWSTSPGVSLSHQQTRVCLVHPKAHSNTQHVVKSRHSTASQQPPLWVGAWRRDGCLFAIVAFIFHFPRNYHDINTCPPVWAPAVCMWQTFLFNPKNVLIRQGNKPDNVNPCLSEHLKLLCLI